MKKFSALSGMFPFAGQVLQGWVALVTRPTPVQNIPEQKRGKVKRESRADILISKVTDAAFSPCSSF